MPEVVRAQTRSRSCKLFGPDFLVLHHKIALAEHHAILTHGTSLFTRSASARLGPGPQLPCPPSQPARVSGAPAFSRPATDGPAVAGSDVHDGRAVTGPDRQDGRKFIGVLRSWDQYANLVLQDTVERIFVQRLYADIPRGIFIVRGENVVLLGEIDLDKDDYIPEPYREAPVELVKSLQRKEQGERARKDKSRHGKLQALGFEGDNAGEALL